MVGPDIGDYMVRRVHTKLGEVVQLPRLARLDADPRIGICWTVMCLVAGVFTPLVPCAWPLVLVLGPFFVAALYRL